MKKSLFNFLNELFVHCSFENFIKWRQDNEITHQSIVLLKVRFDRLFKIKWRQDNEITRKSIVLLKARFDRLFKIKWRHEQ